MTDLLRSGGATKVLVEPSKKRIFRDSEYRAAGAIVTEDLSEACLLIGVKQVEEAKLIKDKSYLFFSHVIKGQPENMPLLQTILDKNVRLFDYECITEGGVKGKPRREPLQQQHTSPAHPLSHTHTPFPPCSVVAFGKFAGVAGMIDVFQAAGQQLLHKGYSTPFLNSPSSYMYRDLVSARFGISSMGRDIANGGLPDTLEPIVFAFTGTNPDGNVCTGAREVFELLPHKYVTVDELPALKASKGPHNCVYGVLVKQEDMTTKKDGSSPKEWSAEDVQHYRKNPDE